MSNCVKPFIRLEQAECYDCMIPIRIYDCEANDIHLTANGIPVSCDQIYSKVYGVCPKCGKTYEVERDGIAYAITSSLKKYISKGDSDNGNRQQTEQPATDYNEFGYVKPSRR